MYYKSTFTVRSPAAEISGERLLGDIRSLTERQVGGAPEDWETEAGSSENSGYWELTTERPTLDRSGDQVRLEIRGWWHENTPDETELQVVTRYRRAGERRRKELPTFPPNIVRTLFREYECRNGTTRLSNRAARVDARDMAAFIENELKSERRRLPILLMTRNRRGQTPQGPEQVQKAIVGAGTVVVSSNAATAAIRDELGKATYDGAMRLIGPGGTKSHYYRRSPELRDLVARCLRITGEDSFDARYEQARYEADNAQLGPDADGTPRDEKVDRRITALEAELKRSEESRARMAQELARLRQETGRDQVDDRLNVTILNQAVNMARDPLRGFIVTQLERRYAGETYQAIRSLRNKHMFKTDDIRRDPKGAIDINDLPHLVSGHPEAFANAVPNQTELGRLLRDLKHARNRAAHPPFGGISKEESLDKLRTVQTVLRYVGLNEPARGVTRLIEEQEQRT